VRVVSDQEEISCGRLCFREMELGAAINTDANLFAGTFLFEVEKSNHEKFKSLFDPDRIHADHFLRKHQAAPNEL